VAYFVGASFDGSMVYTQTFPREVLPKDKVKYVWSVVTASFKLSSRCRRVTWIRHKATGRNAILYHAILQ
jgi:hypothetical protein